MHHTDLNENDYQQATHTMLNTTSVLSPVEYAFETANLTKMMPIKEKCIVVPTY